MVLSQEQLAEELEHARQQGLPLDWTLTLDNQGKKRWTSPGPKSKSFAYLQRALDYVHSKQQGFKSVTMQQGGSEKKPKQTKSQKRSSNCISSSSSVGGAMTSSNGSESKSGKKKSKKSCTVSSSYSSSSSAKVSVSRSSNVPKTHSVNIHPETSLDIGNDFKEHPYKYNRLVGTVHWDPYSDQGQKVGHRIRVWDFTHNVWKSGRIVRYDPVTHQHKVVFFTDKSSDEDSFEEEWLFLSKENVQLGGRFVWALVKGFAWWPAQVLHCSFGSSRAMPKSFFNKKDLTSQPMRDGYVLVEFFDSDEVASIKDSPDFLRDFQQGKVDAVMKKNKKKINRKAVETCLQEETATREVRNDAARFYAEKAFECMNRLEANCLLGSRVEIYRSDINYPTGEYLVGTVRMYSTAMKKYLVAYDPPPHNTKQYSPSWESFTSHKMKLLDNTKREKTKDYRYEPSDLDVYPFLFGHEEVDGGMGTRCRGCVGECDAEQDVVLKCYKCNGLYHPGCLDPPMSEKAVDNLIKSGESWHCIRCLKCNGCRELEIAFGTKAVSSQPASLFLPRNTSLRLCNACLPMYDKEMFCPVCAHVWDDNRYQFVQKQQKAENKNIASELGAKRIAITDHPDSEYSAKVVKDDDKRVASNLPATENEKSALQSLEDHGESLFHWKGSHEVKDWWFYPENNIWGYNEGTMLSCEKCNLWVHAGCAELTEEEYDKTTRGEHPIYSREYLCRKCCMDKCLALMNLLKGEDSMYLFAEPVTDQIAHNYSDVIKNPMDLRTMSERALRGNYRNYSWLREAFELMVYNALLFNPAHSKYWNEAKRYYIACKKNVFSTEGIGAPPSKYKSLIMERFEFAEKIIQAEKDRVKADETAEKKDLVAGDQVMTVELGPLVVPPDPPSCVATTVVRMTPFEAFYCSWLECCFSCGSSGAIDTMLFCVDCGEAYHSFCASAPIHSMNEAAVEGWRCPNCKICEITGEVTSDELKLLYCEMCDRAFSIDSIEPPLDKVPPGLWVCGQCIDCKKCNNTCDNGLVSRKYWSRQHSLCLPCGGCDGLDLPSLRNAKCPVCKKLSRNTEGSPRCSKCKCFIHRHCDEKGLVEYPLVNDGKYDKYCCPKCRKASRALHRKKSTIDKKAKMKIEPVKKVKAAIKKLEKVKVNPDMKEIVAVKKIKKRDIIAKKKSRKKENLIFRAAQNVIVDTQIPSQHDACVSQPCHPNSKRSLSMEVREKALRIALKDAQSRGLPNGWTCIYGSANRKKWRSPPPDSRLFDSLPKALRYAETKNKTFTNAKSIRRLILQLDLEPEWCGRDKPSDENTSLMTDAEVLVRILEDRMKLGMTLLFDPSGELYSVPSHIHHIPKHILSRAARFVRFVKNIRSGGTKKQQQQTAAVDSSAQTVVCKMASAFLYSVCIMFKIDIKSKIKSWRKMISLLVPLDVASGTVDLELVAMRCDNDVTERNFSNDSKMKPITLLTDDKLGVAHTLRNEPNLNCAIDQMDMTSAPLTVTNANNANGYNRQGYFSSQEQASDAILFDEMWLADKNDNDMNAANALITLACPAPLLHDTSNEYSDITYDYLHYGDKVASKKFGTPGPVYSEVKAHDRSHQLPLVTGPVYSNVKALDRSRQLPLVTAYEAPNTREQAINCHGVVHKVYDEKREPIVPSNTISTYSLSRTSERPLQIEPLVASNVPPTDRHDVINNMYFDHTQPKAPQTGHLEHSNLFPIYSANKAYDESRQSATSVGCHVPNSNSPTDRPRALHNMYEERIVPEIEHFNHGTSVSTSSAAKIYDGPLPSVRIKSSLTALEQNVDRQSVANSMHGDNREQLVPNTSNMNHTNSMSISSIIKTFDGSPQSVPIRVSPPALQQNEDRQCVMNNTYNDTREQVESEKGRVKYNITSRPLNAFEVPDTLERSVAYQKNTEDTGALLTDVGNLKHKKSSPSYSKAKAYDGSHQTATSEANEAKQTNALIHGSTQIMQTRIADTGVEEKAAVSKKHCVTKSARKKETEDFHYSMQILQNPSVGTSIISEVRSDDCTSKAIFSDNSKITENHRASPSQHNSEYSELSANADVARNSNLIDSKKEERRNQNSYVLTDVKAARNDAASAMKIKSENYESNVDRNLSTTGLRPSVSVSPSKIVVPITNQSFVGNLASVESASVSKSDATPNTIAEKSERRDSSLVATVQLPWFTHHFAKVQPVRGWDNARLPNALDERHWVDPRTCCLCNIPGDDDAGTDVFDSESPDKYGSIKGSGRLLPVPSGGWVHCGCAMWSSEVWETALGGILNGVGKARARGNKLRCFGCGQYGATLGCHRSACNANFHFPCAKACGVTFTSSHKLYCAAHKQFAHDDMIETFSEPMKILRVGEEEMNADSSLCYRSGSLVIHSLGTIDEDIEGFHSKNYITPSGFTSSRIFWSFVRPKTRTVYIMRIVPSKNNIASFMVSAADAPMETFKGDDVNQVYNDIMDRVLDLNKPFFSHGDPYSVHPMARSKTSRHGFCLNGPQFFGFGVDFVRKALEASPSAVSCAVPLTPHSCQYRFCFQNPTQEDVMDLQRKRAAIKAEQALENSSGCARTEGSSAFDKSKGSGRITRALVRKIDDDATLRTSSALTKGAELSKAGQDSIREFESIQAKYREMKSVPMEDRLAAKRSHIHGWGLFAKRHFPANAMIAEYMGEAISQPIADKREKKYEILGMGSCYMFRLDFHEIVDATSIGCMARFMNHCCAANAYAKVITVTTDKGLEKKIVVFANQEIKMGDEITYDYKFPVEDGSLRCTCGAPNCIGRMN